MHRVHLTYTLQGRDQVQRDLHHPLLAMLAAVHDTGSINAAARQLSMSYRHVWGELKRWETELGHPLVAWSKGRAALLSPFGEKLLWAERRAQARLAPQVEALRSELERAFAIAFDDDAGVLPMAASHDDALPLLRQRALDERRLHLDVQFTGSVGALTVNETLCGREGPFAFVAVTEKVVVPRSPAAGVPLRIPLLALRVAQDGGCPPGVTTAQPPAGITWEAVNWWEYATPGDAARGAALVITGGTTLIVTE